MDNIRSIVDENDINKEKRADGDSFVDNSIKIKLMKK